MDKTFDELFSDFFNRNNPKDDEIFKKIREEAKKIIESINNFDDISNKTEEEMEELLGKPDVIETYFDGFIYYERKVWHTKNGDIVVLTASQNPFEEQKEKSLEEQLQDAIDSEEYEKAAEIRDKIKEIELAKTKKKKTNRNKKA